MVAAAGGVAAAGAEAAGGAGGAAVSFGAVGKTKLRLLRPWIERLWLCVSKRGLGNRFILNARFGAGLVAVVKLAASGFCFLSLGIIDNALAKKTPNREPEDEPAASMMMFCAMSLCFGRML